MEKFRRAEEAAGKELNFIPEKSERMGLRRDRRTVTVADGMIGNVGKFEFEKERQKNKTEK